MLRRSKVEGRGKAELQSCVSDESCQSDSLHENLSMSVPRSAAFLVCVESVI